MAQQHRSRYLPKDSREVVAILAVLLSAFCIFGDEIPNWISHGLNDLQTAFREQTPLDVELHQARMLAESLMPDLRSNQEVIACEQVEIDEFRNSLESERRQLTLHREELLELRLRARSEQHPEIDAKSPSITQVRQMLQEEFDRYRNAEQALKVRENVLHFREDALAKAIQKQNSMLRRKAELELHVQALESRMQLVRREGVDSHLKIDRQKLSSCEELLRSLKRRLAVAEKLADAEANGMLSTVSSGIPDSAENQVIEQAIDTYFLRSPDGEKQ